MCTMSVRSIRILNIGRSYACLLINRGDIASFRLGLDPRRQSLVNVLLGGPP